MIFGGESSSEEPGSNDSDDAYSGNASREEEAEILYIPHVKNTEEASEMVMNIEGRVDKMQDAISNMDKRMSYNIRLFGSIMYECETKKRDEFKEFNLMKRENMNDRLTKAN